MCGIVGYIGKKEALPILLKGLRDLEYRGYDSAGVAVLKDGKIERMREVGKVDMLVKKIGAKNLPGTLGIAHTRWATHGGVTEANAHPHFAGSGKLVIAHNGIIENYRELKEKIKEPLDSETDTEILAKWIFLHYKGDLAEAVRQALLSVRGTYGLAVLHADHPDTMVAARLGSPLVIGLGEDEYYLASDVTPMLPFTKEVNFLEDGQVAEINRKGFHIFNLDDEQIDKKITHIDWNTEQAQKAGFENFMLKEIFDQPTVFEDAIRGRYNMREGTAKLGGLNLSPAEIGKIKRIVMIACGTASYACMAARFAFEKLAGIPAELAVASTKAYTNMVAILILYAIEFGRLRNLSFDTGRNILEHLLQIPAKMNQILEQSDDIKLLADKYKDYQNFLFLGRGINFPVALGGSHKLKEITYIHSEAYPAGEMKHGTNAL